jgi:hypothetical protein
MEWLADGSSVLGGVMASWQQLLWQENEQSSWRHTAAPCAASRCSTSARRSWARDKGRLCMASARHRGVRHMVEIGAARPGCCSNSFATWSSIAKAASIKFQDPTPTCSQSSSVSWSSIGVALPLCGSRRIPETCRPTSMYNTVKARGRSGRQDARCCWVCNTRADMCAEAANDAAQLQACAQQDASNPCSSGSIIAVGS